jgi:hypothetical protein
VILKLPYRKYPAPHAPGGFFYAASLPVHISNVGDHPLSSKRFDAIIDSGATSCLFHASIGRAIGLDIEKGRAAETLGVAGSSREYMHTIALHIPGGTVTTLAGFSYELPIAGLLGMTGFFEHFRVTFDPTELCCELERLHRV